MTRFTLHGTVLDARDAIALAAFWRELLGWETASEHPDWVVLRSPAGGAGLSFQRDEQLQPPVWPAGAGDQQLQLHLDVQVDAVAAAVARAEALGARVAEHQPQEHVRVLLDPEGHPFCLFVPG